MKLMNAEKMAAVAVASPKKETAAEEALTPPPLDQILLKWAERVYYLSIVCLFYFLF